MVEEGLRDYRLAERSEPHLTGPTPGSEWNKVNELEIYLWGWWVGGP